MTWVCCSHYDCATILHLDLIRCHVLTEHIITFNPRSRWRDSGVPGGYFHKVLTRWAQKPSINVVIIPIISSVIIPETHLFSAIFIGVYFIPFRTGYLGASFLAPKVGNFQVDESSAQRPQIPQQTSPTSCYIEKYPPPFCIVQDFGLNLGEDII